MGLVMLCVADHHEESGQSSHDTHQDSGHHEGAAAHGHETSHATHQDSGHHGNANHSCGAAHGHETSHNTHH